MALQVLIDSKSNFLHPHFLVVSAQINNLGLRFASLFLAFFRLVYIGKTNVDEPKQNVQPVALIRFYDLDELLSMRSAMGFKPLGLVINTLPFLLSLVERFVYLREKAHELFVVEADYFDY